MRQDRPAGSVRRPFVMQYHPDQGRLHGGRRDVKYNRPQPGRRGRRSTAPIIGVFLTDDERIGLPSSTLPTEEPEQCKVDDL